MRDEPGWGVIGVTVFDLHQGPAVGTRHDLRTAYEWSRPQEEALFELERHYGVEGLGWLSSFAVLDDLAGFRDVELNGRIALNTWQVVHRRARRIIGLKCIATDPNVSVGGAVVRDLLNGHVVLIDRASGRVRGVFNTLCSERTGLLAPAHTPPDGIANGRTRIKITSSDWPNSTPGG